MTSEEREKVVAIMRELSDAVNSAWARQERQTIRHMNRALSEAVSLGLRVPEFRR